MYTFKNDVCERLLKSSADGYPNPKVIEEYMDGKRKAQKNTVLAFAYHLKVKKWKELTQDVDA